MSLLDDQIRSALDRVSGALRGQLESELITTHADILRAAGEAQAQAVTEAVERASAEAAEQAAAEVRRNAEQQLLVLREAFERQRDELDRSRAVEISGMQQSLDELRREVDAARREVGERQQEAESLREQLAQSRRETDDIRKESDEHFHLVEETRRRLDDAVDGIAQAHRDAEERVAQAQRDVQAEMAEVRREADADLARARTAHERTLTELLRVSRVPADICALEAATSLVDVFDALVRVACQDSGRSAVFLADGNLLRGWRALGFDASNPVEGRPIEMVDAGLLGRALTSGRQDYRAGAGGALPAFAGADGSRDAVAVPVEVAGSVIAVLYADAPETETTGGAPWTDLVDVMAKWAGRLLEAITVRRAAAMSTPRRAQPFRAASYRSE